MPGPSLKKCLDEFFERRVEIRADVLSREVSNVAFEAEKLCDQLQAALPKDERLHKLFDEFVDANSTLRGAIQDFMYQRGFSDGVRFVIHAVSLGA